MRFYERFYSFRALSIIGKCTSRHLFAYGGFGHVLNEQGTGYEHIFSWYKHLISIELKMGHVI